MHNGCRSTDALTNPDNMVCKRSVKAAEQAKQVQMALDRLADGTYLTVCQAVEALNVSEATLRRHLKGGRTRQQGREDIQLLTRQEEKALANWVSGATAAGNPVDRRYIMEMAQGMRESRTPFPEGFLPAIGKDWIKRFLGRHPHLGTKLSKSIERSRISDITPEQIREFNAEFRRVIEEQSIKQKHIYNCDETGMEICALKC